MSLSPDHIRENPDRWIDRLVDDELPEAERRQVLLAMEDIPSLWRRCGLAFLEQQCWRRAMAGMPLVESQPVAAPVAVSAQAKPESEKSRASIVRFGWLGSLAATVMLAFFLGDELRDVWFQPSGMVARHANTGNRLAQPDPLPDSPLTQASAGTPSSVAMEYGQDENGQPQHIDVPVLDPSQFDPSQLLGHEGSPLPAEILRQLENSGYSVRCVRELITFRLPDGRLIVVPVDKVLVEHEGKVIYQ